MDINDEEFQIMQSDLAPHLQEKIREHVSAFCVPIIYDDIFMGTGTLVYFDQVYGILTACHVVENLGKYLDVSINSKQRFQVTAANFVQRLEIESKYLAYCKVDKRMSDEKGPDLAFIKIPPSGFLKQIKAHKNFYNIKKDVDSRKSVALSEYGFMSFCGFPDIDKYELAPSMGFSAVQGLKGGSFVTGPDRYFKEGEYDYYDVGVVYDNETAPPASFGGVSGGALWKVPLYKKSGSDEVFIADMCICGVVFYQSSIEDNRRFIRAHGPVALYEKFFPLISESYS